MNIITLAHGSGGVLTHKLIKEIILKEFNSPILRELTDAAVLKVGKNTIALTTDSYVVKPLFFPGSDIGKMAIYGTVNDLSVCGAKPLFISCGIIIEEGLEVDVLKNVIHSMKEASFVAGVTIVTGDIKVVERGKCDKLYINTSGIGVMGQNIKLSIDNIGIGDKIITSGSIGDHGISVLSAREGINFGGSIKSDAAPLNKLISKILRAGGVRFMRDPTRGGIASTLNEIAEDRNFGIIIEESSILVKQGVYAASELLGLDPLYIANEGKIIVVVSKDSASRILRIMRNDKLGRDARIIGEVVKKYSGKVILKTKVGGSRIVDMPQGELLPRIC
ncbi:MAG: hydrogenase expression/formation protein HypE [Candidatus Omnitrophica bacterium CG07_land_8_20_14_0_80_42_15]|uniref:Hydrogenase expression/formation protein HypE n=1 Tax=Candidatus Aquitaenariimonas noxiae TaxID=1974741 RepID=A0A2J0KWM1_9BACT|nr:MAG: hydrogenase expression/formation protein HypE [Candidatus Omnitrophica bacterium CG07_land_8_20_14_0_80_42_15]